MHVCLVKQMSLLSPSVWDLDMILLVLQSEAGAIANAAASLNQEAYDFTVRSIPKPTLLAMFRFGCQQLTPVVDGPEYVNMCGGQRSTIKVGWLQSVAYTWHFSQ